MVSARVFLSHRSWNVTGPLDDKISRGAEHHLAQLLPCTTTALSLQAPASSIGSGDSSSRKPDQSRFHRSTISVESSHPVFGVSRSMKRARRRGGLVWPSPESAVGASEPVLESIPEDIPQSLSLWFSPQGNTIRSDERTLKSPYPHCHAKRQRLKPKRFYPLTVSLLISNLRMTTARVPLEHLPFPSRGKCSSSDGSNLAAGALEVLSARKATSMLNSPFGARFRR